MYIHIYNPRFWSIIYSHLHIVYNKCINKYHKWEHTCRSRYLSNWHYKKITILSHIPSFRWMFYVGTWKLYNLIHVVWKKKSTKWKVLLWKKGWVVNFITHNMYICVITIYYKNICATLIYFSFTQRIWPALKVKLEFSPGKLILVIALYLKNLYLV